MKLELRGQPTEQLFVALQAGLTEPTRSTMDPVDFARPRWMTAFALAAVTAAWALGFAVMIAVTTDANQAAADYRRTPPCDSSRTTTQDCRQSSRATINEIVYRTDHYRYLWESEDQRLELLVADGTTVEARFDGTPNWHISVGQHVTAEIWRTHVTEVRIPDLTERTAVNPIVEAEGDRTTTIGLSLIALAFGIGTAVTAARAAWYKPLSDYV
jgi:hypothetical protein